MESLVPPDRVSLAARDRVHLPLQSEQPSTEPSTAVTLGVRLHRLVDESADRQHQQRGQRGQGTNVGKLEILRVYRVNSLRTS